LTGVAQGTLVSQLSTSSDGLTYNAYAAPSPTYVTARYVKSKFTVSGSDPTLVSAALSYFRRS
jgi:hypothetical protein